MNHSSVDATLTGERIAAVLVNWNAQDLTEQCIRSLLRGSLCPSLIVIVDNASTTFDAEALTALSPRVDVVRNESNLGFTGGNRVGIERARTHGFDYLWLLNNDTIVAPACLAELRGHMTATPACGAATPVITCGDPDNPQIWYGQGVLNHHSLRGMHTIGVPPRPSPVGFISGCSLLMRRKTLEQVGGLNDAFFAYMEDVEWCIRAARAGVQLDCVPSARIHHLVSASLRRAEQTTGRFPPLYHQLYVRNWAYIIRLHARGSQRLTAPLALGTYCAILCTGFIVKRRWAKLGALRKGLRDARAMPIQTLRDSTTI